MVKRGGDFEGRGHTSASLLFITRCDQGECRFVSVHQLCPLAPITSTLPVTLPVCSKHSIKELIKELSSGQHPLFNP